jgi:hypothetical protein
MGRACRKGVIASRDEGDHRRALTVPARADDANWQAFGTGAQAFLAMQVRVASYIEDMGLEMSSIARAAQLGSLAYFIDMMRLEAAISRQACEKMAPDVLEAD